MNFVRQKKIGKPMEMPLPLNLGQPLNHSPNDDLLLPAEGRTELRLLVPKIWNFYETLAVKEEHWLPPDNIRIEPGRAVAHRTSPTNIGFLLLAMVAALDFKLIDADELSLRLGRVLTTLEGMKRFEGHLCNWYDTLTLDVLLPHFISSVDSGNLVAALIVVKQACIELGETDTKNSTRWQALAQRANTLVQDMDFRFMYNEERDLFSIGYNLETDQPVEKYYDLFGSEARLTSFITIGLGQAPERHWFQLGRPLRSVNGQPTMICWGGSLFEYLMPTLFMPDYAGTFLADTYEKVIRCHIQYGKAHSIPWGNGEAGYYAFDQDSNYQYKMFGVPELSIRSEIAPELVVPAYATFLTLPYAPGLAWQNLQTLKGLGGVNEFGFYESFDFTPGRLGAGQTTAVVQEFMAHHQGICLTALDNFFNDAAIRRRFWSEPSMSAVEFLLHERIPYPADKSI